LLSFLGHPGFAEPSEISGFEEGAGVRRPPKSGSVEAFGPQAGDARITTGGAQSLGFNELQGGSFGAALLAIYRSKEGMNVW
jgi:hypothetical protein